MPKERVWKELIKPTLIEYTMACTITGVLAGAYHLYRLHFLESRSFMSGSLYCTKAPSYMIKMHFLCHSKGLTPIRITKIC